MAIDAQLITEYQLATTAAVWRQRAGRGLLEVSGPDGAAFFQGQVTNDVEGLQVGDGCYAALLTAKGKMRADMRILRVAEDVLWVESSAAALALVSATIKKFRVGFDFTSTDLTENFALFSMIGPKAHETLERLTGVPVPLASDEHANVVTAIEAVPVTAAGTDLGVDVLVTGNDQACDHVAEALTAALGPPVGAETVETLRVESGRPLLGREIDGETIPQEAAINERAVNFEKGCYVGQETVARLFYKGKPNRQLRGLRLHGPAVHGEAVTSSEGKLVGIIGTAVDSPRHGTIALAILRREAQPGDEVSVGAANGATVVEPKDFSTNRN
ncbi:MAG: folate-binding protein YgfZ [Thermoleophilaceae bacterium]|nr:folate-binding protein YgfZ [Thermoleophilaceae bacterium]